MYPLGHIERSRRRVDSKLAAKRTRGARVITPLARIKAVKVLFVFLSFALCVSSAFAQTATPWQFAFDANQNLVMPNAQGVPTRRFLIGLYDTSGYGGTVAWWSNQLTYVLSGDNTDATDAADGYVDVYLNYFQGASPASNRVAIGQACALRGMAYLDTENQNNSNIWDTSTNPPTLITSYLAPIVQAEVGRPGMLGAYTADEPCNDPNKSGNYNQVSQLHKFYDTYWPGGVQFGVMRANEPLYVYNAANDTCSMPGYQYTGVMSQQLGALGTDPYLLYWARPLENIVNFLPYTLSWANSYGKRVKPYWYVQQFWGYSNGIDGWPTQDQMRRESWTAICMGVNGIFYWSFGAMGLSYVAEPQRSTLFNEWLAVIKEIKSYEPALTGTPVALPETLPRGVIGIARETSDGVTHVFTINASGMTISDSNGHRWQPHQTIFWTE